MEEDMIETETVETRYGPFEVPCGNDLIANALRQYGEWAQNELSVLCAFLKPSDTVLDIGACFGTHSRAFSATVGPKGRVLSFEGNPETFTVLEKNIALAPIANIEARLGAVGSSREGTVNVVSNTENLGASWMSESRIQGSSPIQTMTVDDLNLRDVAFLKLDVEGSEPDVILGARRTIEQARPAVFCEVNDVDSCAKLLSVFDFDNYRVFGVRTQAYNPNSFHRTSDNMFGTASECGLLFLPDERVNTSVPVNCGTAYFEIDGLEGAVSLMLGQVQYLQHLIAAAGTGDNALVDMNTGFLEARHQTQQLQPEMKQFRDQIASAKDQLETAASAASGVLIHPLRSQLRGQLASLRARLPGQSDQQRADHYATARNFSGKAAATNLSQAIGRLAKMLDD